MVDITFLKEFTKGDKKKMSRYIGLYLQVAPETFMKMKENLEEQDFEQFRINAHSLKPQADFMGIAELKALLLRMEEIVQKGNCDGLNELYDKALEAHKTSQDLLQKKLDELNP